MQTKQGSTKTNILIVIIFCLLAVAGVEYFFIKQKTSIITAPAQSNTYGMSQYVDSHGFSFWYPSSLQITPAITEDSISFPGGVSVETLQIGQAGGTSLFVVDSPQSTITDEPMGHASPIPQTEYSYNITSGQWMVTYPEGTDNQGSSATTTADISKITISGLFMLPSGRRFDTTIIPLNTTRFVVITDGGGSSFTGELAKTITLTGATIDPAIQSAALEAEANAYSSGNGTAPGNQTSSIQPAITSLSPTSGKVGTSVTITGSGFTGAGNKIEFGNLGIENNPNYVFSSPDGATITFTVPYSNYLACWANGCEAPAYLTSPGQYKVSVINDNGASNQVLFTVTTQ